MNWAWQNLNRVVKSCLVACLVWYSLLRGGLGFGSCVCEGTGLKGFCQVSLPDSLKLCGCFMGCLVLEVSLDFD